MSRMHDEDVMRHIRDQTRLDSVRRVFSAECARIEQACSQRPPPSSIELRRMEFEAVRKIALALGVVI